MDENSKEIKKTLDELRKDVHFKCLVYRNRIKNKRISIPSTLNSTSKVN